MIEGLHSFLNHFREWLLDNFLLHRLFFLFFITYPYYYGSGKLKISNFNHRIQ
jgi:hypothetical protein